MHRIYGKELGTEIKESSVASYMEDHLYVYEVKCQVAKS